MYFTEINSSDMSFVCMEPEAVYRTFFYKLCYLPLSPFFIGKEVLRKRNTKIVGLIFHHSSSRTPNFSVHQSCLKCIKARRSGQHTEWKNLVVLFVLLEFVSVSGGVEVW